MALISWVQKTPRKQTAYVKIRPTAVTYILKKNCRQSFTLLSLNASGSIVFIGLSDSILEKKERKKNISHDMWHTGYLIDIQQFPTLFNTYTLMDQYYHSLEYDHTIMLSHKYPVIVKQVVIILFR